NNFFLNRAGKGKPTLRYNQIGASLGGPIRRDRTFFFLNYEAFRQRDGQAFVGTVPTTLERSGNYSQTFLPNGQLRVIVDPFTNPQTSVAGIRLETGPPRSIPAAPKKITFRTWSHHLRPSSRHGCWGSSGQASAASRRTAFR